MPNNHNDDVLLRVEHLCQYFGNGAAQVKAVDDVSFDVMRGEVFGLVGESGCGKTTTGRSIIRLYDITGGSIYFNGRRIGAGTLGYKKAIQQARKELSKAKGGARRRELKAYIEEQREELIKARFDAKNSDRMYGDELAAEVVEKYEPLIAAAATEEEKKNLKKRCDAECRMAKKQKYITRIQMIFQDPISSLDPRMTVYEIIAEGLTIRGEKDKKVIDEKVYSVLEKVGLVREHAGRYPHEFSGGQRQRIGVARAIVMEPEMIIADEPVSALDVSIQAQVINLLNDLRNEMGLTILFIAHDLSVVKYFSDRIGVMYYGKMVEMASSDELFRNPMHPYTRSLLSAIPLPDPRYEKQRKRITYNPLAAHDYSTDKPEWRELKPGHFVQCNEAEYQQYMSELK